MMTIFRKTLWAPLKMHFFRDSLRHPLKCSFTTYKLRFCARGFLALTKKLLFLAAPLLGLAVYSFSIFIFAMPIDREQREAVQVIGQLILIDRSQTQAKQAQENETFKKELEELRAKLQAITVTPHDNTQPIAKQINSSEQTLAPDTAHHQPLKAIATKLATLRQRWESKTMSQRAASTQSTIEQSHHTQPIKKTLQQIETDILVLANSEYITTAQLNALLQRLSLTSSPPPLSDQNTPTLRTITQLTEDQ